MEINIPKTAPAEELDQCYALARRLTPLQRAFVHYLMSGENATQAYSLAGGKSSNKTEAAYRMQKLPNVEAYLKALIKRAAAGSVMDKREAMERLTEIARFRITDAIEFKERSLGEDEFGNEIKQAVWSIKDSTELSKEAAGCIKSVTAGQHGLKIEFLDVMSAIKQLSELNGWSKESSQVGNIEVIVTRRIIEAEHDT